MLPLLAPRRALALAIAPAVALAVLPAACDTDEGPGPQPLTVVPAEAAPGPGTPRLADPEPLGPGEAVAVADLDGDGADEVIRYSEGTLYGPWGEAPLPGSWQGAAAGVLGDGPGETLVVVTGSGRTDREAPLRVFTSTGEAPVLAWERAGERDQAGDLRVVDGRIWLAAFADTWEVSGGWLVEGAFTEVSRARLATAQLPRPDGSVVLARLYGDEPRSDGMVLHRGPDGSDRTLPSLRGARALAAADLDGDGNDELLLGDGWHYQYGEKAVGRVQLLAGPGWSEGRTIAMLPGSYAVNHLEVAPLPDGRPAVLASGSGGAALLVQDRLGWALHEVGPLGESDQARLARLPGGQLAVISPGSPDSPATLRRVELVQ